jgi:hypothetical protein
MLQPAAALQYVATTNINLKSTINNQQPTLEQQHQSASSRLHDIMPLQSIWASIDVPLPPLRYENTTAAGQGKGSTEWAAHSHTPGEVVEWTEFDALVTAEGAHARNALMVDVNLSERLNDQAEDFRAVSEEEHVTDCLKSLLEKFASRRFNLSAGFDFPKRSNELTSAPDLIAMERNDEALGVGDISEYKSPTRGTKAKLRRDNLAMVRSLYRFPFETKPVWKFPFLNHPQAQNDIISEWEIPEDFDEEKMQAEDSLPSHWSSTKKKIFHVVRQLYGQMFADDRRYGILHVYEVFFFCKRTQESTFMISRAFRRTATSPSVLQAIKTMVGFSDHILIGGVIHPKSASKAAKKPKKTQGSRLPASFHDTRGGSTASGKQGRRGTQGNASTKGKNLAASLYPWDCKVYDVTDNILLMKTSKYPSLLVKIQQNPRKRHVADEMAHEAEVYAALGDNEAVQEAIVAFHGHSNHLGVAMTCIEQEMDDLDDIGLENVSEALKRSAVHAVSLLSDAGILHNDLELRNIVQSKDDPDRAKIIDFGRAVFTSDRHLLVEQVQRVKSLLGIHQ